MVPRSRNLTSIALAILAVAGCYRRCECPCCHGEGTATATQTRVTAQARVRLNCHEVCNNFMRTCHQSCSLHGPSADPCNCSTVWLDCMESCSQGRPINTIPSPQR